MPETTTLPPKFQMEALTGRFQSIALVGNSPKLLEADHGAAVDAHDVVIRINDGPTAGLERHTGTRTSVRFLGAPMKARYRDFFSGLVEDSVIATRSENGPALAELGWSGRMVLIQKYGWIMRNAFKRLTEVIDIAEIPARNPRTGILLLSMLTDAMQAGRRISMYGFELAERREGPEHFFDDKRSMADVMQSWEKFHCPPEYEFSAIRKLRDRGFVEVN